MERIKVFLSYKNSDMEGNKTHDAVLAEELYEGLTNRGISTFYSNHTISILGESHYKMAIDKALDEAIVLVAVGTSAENLNSNWVNYEWDSFYGDILSGRKDGQVVSYIDNMEMIDLPRSLRRCQSFKKGESTVEDICDFICAYLDSKKEDITEITAKDCCLLNLTELMKNGITALDAEKAFAENDKGLYEGMPETVAGTPEQWASIIQRHPELTAVVADDNFNIYGNYSLMGLSSNEEKLMRTGKLRDSELKAESADDLYKAGQHIGYLLNISVNPSSESAELYNALWDHLIETLKWLATEKNVYLSKLYYKAFLPEHEAKVVARGFRLCCKDEIYGNVYVHDMDPESTLFALDQSLAEAYSISKKQSMKPKEEQIQDVAALTAYMDFWKQLEELFYQPEYIRLKKYFLGGAGLPQNTVEKKLALAVSEWIRDNLQYSEALLPFIPESQRRTHQQYKEMIYSSKIIQESVNTYQFTTEDSEVEPPSIGGYSVNALIAFANIWLDIDKMFMLPDLLDYRQYFYECNNELPPDEEIELGKMIAIRIASVFKVSERLLRQLPVEYAESYFNYKEMIIGSALTRCALEKYSALQRLASRVSSLK